MTIMGPGAAGGISDNGEFVVGGDGGTAFLWSASAGQVSIGGTFGTAVSDAGDVVIGSLPSASGGFIAGRWTPATGWVELGSPVGVPPPSYSLAADMTADGSVVVGRIQTSLFTQVPFLWTEAGGMVQLPLIGSYGAAFSISQDGSIVTGTDGGQPALWELPSGTERLLPMPALTQGPLVDPTGTWVAAAATSGTGAFIATWSESDGSGTLPMATIDCNVAFGTSAYLTAISAGGERFVGQRTVECLAPGGEVLARTVPTVGTPLLGHLGLVAAVQATGMTTLLPTSEGVCLDITADGTKVVGLIYSSGWFMATLDESIGSSYCGPAALNSSGQSATVRAEGLADASANAVLLVVEGLPPGVFGFFLNGTLRGNSPITGGSQGILCLAGSIGRHDAAVQNSGPGGSFGLRLDLTQLPTGPGPVTVMSGETWHFQAWFRDANPGLTSNTSNGVSITF